MKYCDYNNMKLFFLLWNQTVTNLFIKKEAKGLEKVQKSLSKFGQFHEKFAFLITNLKVC